LEARVAHTNARQCTYEIWQIDDTFFVVFETRIEDFGLEDPKISGQPTLHSFTFVKKLPTLEEMIDHSR